MSEASVEQKSTPVRDAVAPFACVLLLFSGAIKSSPLLAFLPFDLTLVAAALVCLGLAVKVAVDGLAFSVDPRAVAFFAAFLPAWFFGVQNDYVDSKMQGMLLTAVAMLGSFYLLSSEVRRKRWAMWFVVLGGFVLLNTLAFPNVEAVGRLAAEGSNTITAGRATGAALIVVFSLLLVTRGARRLALLGLTAVFAYGMLETGSRGPVLAAALAVIAVALFVNQSGRIRRIVLVGLGLVAGWLFISSSDSLGVGRIQAAFVTDGAATESRDAIWGAALRYLSNAPESFTGVGWANFQSVLRNGEALASGDRQYPHNLLLETLVEGGLVAGLATAVFVALSLVRLRRSAATPIGVVLFAMAVFFTVNAMVSGDVNDNRMMWATLAVAWAVPVRPRRDAGRAGAGAGLTDESPTPLVATGQGPR